MWSWNATAFFSCRKTTGINADVNVLPALTTCDDACRWLFFGRAQRAVRLCPRGGRVPAQGCPVIPLVACTSCILCPVAALTWVCVSPFPVRRVRGCPVAGGMVSGEPSASARQGHPSRHRDVTHGLLPCPLALRGVGIGG